MAERIHFRLRDVLLARYQKLGSWSALEKNISQANGGKRKVDRRKLKRLCSTEFEKESLSVSELIALDQYLIRHNEGLAENPIFTRQDNLLDTLAEGEAVNFFVSAKYHPDLGTEAMSRWDMRSITRLMRTKLGSLDLRIWDILVKEDWLNFRERASDQAIVCIGSPFASAGTECLLADMFSIRPFETAQLESLPFYFVEDAADSERTSAFIRPKDEAIQHGINREPLLGARRAIVVLDEVFSESPGIEYGLILAQRHRAGNQVHMALCGLSGPATYGLAKFLQREGIPRTLPKVDSSQCPPVLLTVLKCEIELMNASVNPAPRQPLRERRKLVSTVIVRAPRLFYYSDRGWHEGDDEA